MVGGFERLKEEAARDVTLAFQDYSEDAIPATGDPNPANVLKDVLAKFDVYFSPRKNELVARYKFRRCMQETNETLEAYVTRLKILVKDCNYGNQRDKQLRDQVVFGCTEDKLRQKLFEVEDLTLEKTLDLCVAFQASKRQMDVIKSTPRQTNDSVAKVREKPRREKTTGSRHDADHDGRPRHENNEGRPKSSRPSIPTNKLRPCKFCGEKHEWRKEKCPAHGKKCTKCGKYNHYAVKCKSRKINYVSGNDNDFDVSSSDESECEYLLKVSSKKDKLIEADFEVNGKIIKFQVDCGASVNVIPQYLIPNVNLKPCDTTLEVWTLDTVRPKGKCRLVIRNCKNRKKYNLEFLVVDCKYPPLLSKRTSEQMGLITVNYENISATKDVLDKYDNVFNTDVGTFQNVVRLTIDTNAEPVVIPKCRVPINLKNRVCKKINEMEKHKIIAKVDQPTDWVSRMVVAEKENKDLRICIDPQALNKSLKREHLPTPVIDDILPQLSKAKVFSFFDLVNGYWHCVLDEKSSFLTTFQTPFGRYRWLRLPFGLNVSGEIFQKQLLLNLENLDGVVCIADDVIVYGVGETYEEAVKDHDSKIIKFLERCQAKGIKLNKSKAVLRKSEITFLGHKITSKGFMPDPKKVEAILNMKPPTDVTGVKEFTGMVNYLSKFLPNLSEVLEPIRKLTPQNTEWNWTEKQEKAFIESKRLITNAPILQYYDPNLDLVIQCDASQNGLGSVLLQCGKPIAFASRALSETEKRYAQIEKETLAIVFSLRKFHEYVYGRKIIVESDHKPIASIVLKPLCNAPKRLQGMLLNILQYDVEIIHKKGKEMYVADALSRSYLPLDNYKESEEQVNMLDYLPVRKERLDEIKYETDQDETLQILKSLILKGWPEGNDEIPNVVRAYSHTKDEYSVQDGLIFKSNRIVIPLNLRHKIIKVIHSAHIGIEGCLRRARECIYWPGMNSDIKQFILSCEICNKFPCAQQKETLINHEIADRPWQKVGVDLMSIEKHNYLITVDYFSSFWEIDYLENTLASTVIRKLKSHFARYGLPCVLISDNGPQFVNENFKQFATDYDFEHRTSSPTHAQSNGMVES
ncbi:uncharacterized protein K02A2.6-like [Macrobrachium nipponense]|uniref:uncharacterized protein K02A2.6-like n=1 Tax=Macrobrachium nipponense TaxID=159736 RepID=UPI0030C89999